MSSAEQEVWAGSDTKLLGSDGWFEGGEAFHNDRALDDLDDGFLESCSWLAFLRDWHVEKDGQELRPDCGGGGVRTQSVWIWHHWHEAEALDEGVAPSAWTWSCTWPA